MKLAGLVALPILIMACQKEEKGVLKPESSIFNADDLKVPSGVDTISEQEISETLNYVGSLRAGSGAALVEDSSCLQQRINALPIKADKANVSVVAEFDAKDCFAPDAMGSLTLESLPVRFVVWLGCDNKDLEALDGKMFGAVSDEVAIKCSTTGAKQGLTNLEFKLVASGTMEDDDGNPVSIRYTDRTVSAQQTADGQPCELSMEGDSWLYKNECVDVNKYEVTQFEADGRSVPKALTGDYVRLEYIDIQQSTDQTIPWFEGGHFNLTLDNWTGTVAYTGGNVAPNWTMSNGTTEMSGTLSIGGATQLIEKECGGRWIACI